MLSFHWGTDREKKKKTERRNTKDNFCILDRSKEKESI